MQHDALLPAAEVARDCAADAGVLRGLQKKGLLEIAALEVQRAPFPIFRRRTLGASN
jgi:hypothetical protein